MNDQSHLIGYDKKWEFPIDSKSIDKNCDGSFVELDRGHYGVVFRAIPKQPFYDEAECIKTVFVKMGGPKTDKVIIVCINCVELFRRNKKKQFSYFIFRTKRDLKCWEWKYKS